MISRQLYEGEHKPTEERMEPIKNRESTVKPSGGLWTSSYDETYGSAWIQWCIDENFRVPDDGFNGWVLHVGSQPKLLIIDSLADLIQALQTHGMIYEPKHPLYEYQRIRPTLDFESLSRDFDGMRLTTRGQYETRLSYPESLYGWDCESTLWFNWCFNKVEPLGKKSFITWN